MEIDDQSQWNIKQFHVAEQLSFRDRKNLSGGFQLDKQGFVNQQIEAEWLLAPKLLVPNNYLCYLRGLLFNQSLLGVPIVLWKK